MRLAMLLSEEDEFELYPMATNNSQLSFTQPIGFSYEELRLYSGP